MRCAFTLIELMMVIAVIAIAIIAAIAIPNLLVSSRAHGARYHINNGTTFWDTDAITRLPDGGIRFLDERGMVVEIHGSFYLRDSQAQAEAGR